MPISGNKKAIVKRYRISKRKLRLIVRCFALDLTASQTAGLALVNRNTVNRYYAFLRALLIEDALLERQREQIGNGVEIDESYFDPKRIRGRRGRGASKKIIVLGLRKRNGKVHGQIIPDTTRHEIMPIIQSTVKSGADIYTDGWRSYDVLAIYGYNHKKVKHSENEFAKEDGTHINGIESYWSFAKRRLAKFNGIPKHLFPKNLLETEWRFNHRDGILKSIRRLLKTYKQSHSL